jgi:hypothetical protein
MALKEEENLNAAHTVKVLAVLAYQTSCLIHSPIGSQVVWEQSTLDKVVMYL